MPVSSKKIFNQILDASLVRNMRKSSSFTFRLKRFIFGDYFRFGLISPTGLLRFTRSLFNALPGVFHLLRVRYIKAALSCQELLEITEDFKPSMIVSWSFSIEPITIFGIISARVTGCKSLAVYDNWDNLSSKAVLVELPDFVVCFGEQSRGFATEIQGMKKENVFPIGSARFDKLKTEIVTSKLQERKVLIAGSSLALEDKAILDAISSGFKDRASANSLESIKFVYRPHPQPQGANLDIDSWDSSLISLDSSSLSFRGDNWQDQGSYVDLLKSYQLVIAAPTTLMIEALVLGKHVIVPALSVKGINTSIRKMIVGLEHLKAIHKLRNVSIVYTERDLISAVIDSFTNVHESRRDENLDQIVTTTPGTFASRFTHLLEDLLAHEMQQLDLC